MSEAHIISETQKISAPTIAVETFGCRLNALESEAIRRAAQAAGLEQEVLILNTGAVTNEAMRQARQTIRRMRREHPTRPIIVTGCGAQIEPETFANMDEVSLVLGNREKTDPQIWAHLKQSLAEGERMRVGDIMQLPDQVPSHEGSGLVDSIEGQTRAFVEVQTGCDHRCTFCIIPYGRGPSRSVPLAAIVTQLHRIVERGIHEVVLTGVDLTSWGHDLSGAPQLGQLVRELLRAVPHLPRLRLSSIDCIEADPLLLDVMAHEPRLMPHLHLSLQAGDDLILKRMKRRHTRAQAIAFCDSLRHTRPDLVFGADIITGFPTESEDMFQRSLDLVDECGLTHLHVFPFSPRAGTPAAKMPQVDPKLRKERASRLRAKGSDVLNKHLQAQIGRTLHVLTERGGIARAEDFTSLTLEAEIAHGQLLDVQVTRLVGQTLFARPV